MSKAAMKSGDLIPLSEQETAELIRASTGRVLSIAFGPGGAALQWRSSTWALSILARMRGIYEEHGSGI